MAKNNPTPGTTPAPSGAGFGAPTDPFAPVIFSPKPTQVAPPNQAPYLPGKSPAQQKFKTAHAPPAKLPTHEQTQKAAQTMALQRHLRSLGYNIAVDGVDGPETEHALKLSQQGQSHNLGIVHPQAAKDAAAQQVNFEQGLVNHKLLDEGHGPLLAPVAPTAPDVGSPQIPHFEQMPSHYSATKRYAPSYPGEPKAGEDIQYFNQSTQQWVQPGGKVEPGAIIQRIRPYYTTAHTQSQIAGKAKAQADSQVFGLEFGQPITSDINQAYKVASPVTQSVVGGIASFIPGVAVGKALAQGKTSPGDIAKATASDFVNAAALFGADEARVVGKVATTLARGGDAGAVIRDAVGAKKAAQDARIVMRNVTSSSGRDAAIAAWEQTGASPREIAAALSVHDKVAIANAADSGLTPAQEWDKFYASIQAHPDTAITTGDVLGGHVTGLAQEGAKPEIQNAANTPPEHAPADPVVLKKAAAKLVRQHKAALPEGFNTPKRLEGLLNELRARAVEASDFRHWYSNSAQAIMTHVNGNVQEADKIAALIAVYSPRAEVYSKATDWNNLDRALNAYQDYQQTGRVSNEWSISKTGAGGVAKEGEADWQTHRAQQILEGNFAWGGLKTNRFYRNFLQHIDPAKYAEQFGAEKFGTMDTWMRRAFKYPKKYEGSTTESTLFGDVTKTVGKAQEPITDPMYRFMEQANKAVGDSLGWSPEQVQAAIWTSIKAESEHTPLEQAGFDFSHAFEHRETRIAKPVAPEQLALEAHTADQPVVSDVQAAIEASRAPDSGFTLTAGLRHDQGNGRFIVAYGAYELRDKAPLTAKALLDFRNAHLDALKADPSLRVGGWHNPDDGHIYLDLSRTFATHDEAMQFAREQGQLSIYDRENPDASLPTGLTPEQADTIKAGHREVARLNTQKAVYDKLLLDTHASYGGKSPRSGVLSQRDRKAAEDALFATAEKHPEYLPLVEKLSYEANLSTQRSITDLFQDDPLVQHIADAQGLSVDHAGILERSAGKNLEGLPKARVSNKAAQDIARDYMKDAGLPYRPPTKYVKVNPDFAERVAQWYEHAQSAPEDAAVKKSYDAFAKETLAQYDAIHKAGYRFEFYPGHNPYPSGPSAAIDDLRQNHHLYVFPTEGGFGTEHVATEHPLLGDSGVKWGGQTVTHNDLFRAVHDFMGHFKEGVGFRADGEDNAWRAHVAMYSDEAKPAMTAETRGQNSWVNYGPHGEANKAADQGATVYADQKAVLAPDWVMGKENLAQGEGFSTTASEDLYGKQLAKERRGAADRRQAVREAHAEPERRVAARRTAGEGAPVKGLAQRTDIGEHLVHYFKGSDVSTIMHEFAHALEPHLPEEIRSSLKAAAEKAGATNYDEFVARSFERYLAEGNAPTEDLAKPFRDIAASMAKVYDDSALIPGSASNPELRSTFDKFFKREAMADPQWAAKVGNATLAQNDTFPAWWGDQSKPVVGAQPLKDVYKDARDWLADTSWSNMEPEDIHALSDETVQRAVAKYYDGGWDEFLRSDPTNLMQTGDKPPEDFWGHEDTPPDDSLATTGGPLVENPKEIVSQNLAGARSVRGKQEAGYSEERAARRAEADQVMQAKGGVEGYISAMQKMKGELPKIDFGGFKELNAEALDHLFVTIQQHPNLSFYQKIRTQRALLRGVEGHVPTKGELTLLENIFGKTTADGLKSIPTLPEHIKNLILEILNVPRSLMASFDVSAPLRQGLVIGARHPRIFFRNFKQMFEALGSERAYQGIMDDVTSRPTFHMMETGGLAITDMEGLTEREEQFYSNLAEKIPVAGRGVRASGRAYTGFLVKTRADVFDHLIRVAEAQGHDVQDPEFLKSLSTYINAATGRGSLGKLTSSAPVLNTIFFSPRLLASRVNFLNPFWYRSLDPFARREALRSALQLGGAAGTVLMLAKLGGATVNGDPRNADFAKIRIGNTRLDILGGFQQPIRLTSQLVSGKIISSTTGDPLSLGPQGPGAVSRRDIIQRFFEGKLAPTPSVVNDWLKGTNFQGQKFSWKQEAIQHLVPLIAQDATDLYNMPVNGVNGIAAAFAGYGVEAFGVGLQTYGPVDKSKAKVTKLQKQAKEAGLPAPPQEVLIDLKHKTQLDSLSQANAGDSIGRMKAYLKYYEQTTGDTEYTSIAKQIEDAKDTKDADTLNAQIRKSMIGNGLSQYEHAIKQSGVK